MNKKPDLAGMRGNNGSQERIGPAKTIPIGGPEPGRTSKFALPDDSDDDDFLLEDKPPTQNVSK